MALNSSLELYDHRTIDCTDCTAPIVLVPKKDWSLHFCVPFRKLNAMNIRSSYPTPGMDEWLDSFGDGLIFCPPWRKLWQFSSLSRLRWFWQDKGFISHPTLLKFWRNRFGLHNAPGTVQQPMDVILLLRKRQLSLVWLDDVIIFMHTNIYHIFALYFTQRCCHIEF